MLLYKMKRNILIRQRIVKRIVAVRNREVIRDTYYEREAENDNQWNRNKRLQTFHTDPRQDKPSSEIYNEQRILNMNVTI